MDITIKNIPEEIEEIIIDQVAELVEGFYYKDLKPLQKDVDTFETKVDDFRVDNNLPKKYDGR